MTLPRRNVSRPKSGSGVSQTLRMVSDQLEDLNEKKPVDATGAFSLVPGYRVVTSCEQRAKRLSSQRYLRQGYQKPNEGLASHPCRTYEHRAVTFLFEDQEGHDAGTVTLIFDSSLGLPADELYAEQIQSYRDRGRRLVEVTSLALSEDHAGAKLLLVRLFNLIYLFARKVHHYDDFVIEVNPRHVGYYQRLLKFERIGEQKACPRVNGAPAGLLRLDLKRSEQEIELCRKAPRHTGSKLLYRHAYTPQHEKAACVVLKRIFDRRRNPDAVGEFMLPARP